MRSLLSILLLGSVSQALRIPPDTADTSLNDFDKIPVVYMWLGNAELPSYFKHTAKASAQKNDVIILVEDNQRFASNVSSRISFIDLKFSYLHKDEMFFKQDGSGNYRHWGKHEPWEQGNLQRFFILNSWMTDAKAYEHIFFADADVAILSDASQLWKKQYSGCDIAMNLQDGESVNQERENSVGSMRWTAWAGSAFLNQKTLDDFEQFAKQMYNDENIYLLKQKKNTSPYVCDMTLWYLFAASAGAYQDAHTSLKLPKVSAKSICNNEVLRDGGHFDWQSGHSKAGFSIDENGASYGLRTRTQLHTVHFQGASKRKAEKTLAKYIR